MTKAQGNNVILMLLSLHKIITCLSKQEVHVMCTKCSLWTLRKKRWINWIWNYRTGSDSNDTSPTKGLSMRNVVGPGGVFSYSSDHCAPKLW